MRHPLDSTPQRALVHILNGNVDAARASLFFGSRHREYMTDSLRLVDANPKSMQSRYVLKRVGKKRLKFLEDHRRAYGDGKLCRCARQPDTKE